MEKLKNKLTKAWCDYFQSEVVISGHFRYDADGVTRICRIKINSEKKKTRATRVRRMRELPFYLRND